MSIHQSLGGQIGVLKKNSAIPDTTNGTARYAAPHPKDVNMQYMERLGIETPSTLVLGLLDERTRSTLVSYALLEWMNPRLDPAENKTRSPRSEGLRELE